jgi:hypothetical protein
MSQPAGLNNLGATCYVNAVLQCLFSNAAFRAGVYAAEPAVLERAPALRLLRCAPARVVRFRASCVVSAWAQKRAAQLRRARGAAASPLRERVAMVTPRRARVRHACVASSPALCGGAWCTQVHA